MLVLLDDDRLALSPRDRHRRYLLRQPSVRLRLRRLLLRAEREGILVLAADVVVLGDVLAGLRHGIDAVELAHERIDEPPADGRVVDFRLAGKGGLRLRHHEGRPRHAFRTAGDRQLGLPRADRARRLQDRVHAGTAQAVDRVAGDARRQAREQQRHAADIAVVLAGLRGIAPAHVVDGLPVDAPVALHQRADRHGREIVGPHGRQRAAETADGGADIVADECLGHDRPAFAPPSCAAFVRACRSRRVVSSSALGGGVSSSWSAKTAPASRTSG